MEVSTKVTRGSAIAGVLVALTYGAQQIQTVADAPDWLVGIASVVLVMLGAFGTGYQTTEKKPSPSMLTAAGKG